MAEDSEASNPVLADFKNAGFNAFLMMRFAARPENRQIRESLEASLSRYAIYFPLSSIY